MESDIESLAETCVCFANAQGGTVVVGIENKQSEPPSDQRINTSEMNKAISRLRTLTSGVGIVNPEIHTHENGGEYFSFKILPSTRIRLTTAVAKKLFLKLLNDDYLFSHLTNLQYESQAKDKL